MKTMMKKENPKFLYEKKESLQHRHFPCGPPPQYYTGCTQLKEMFTARLQYQIEILQKSII